MSSNSIKTYRVHVLDNDVQKYASTTLSGGGGYVATVNGTTYGQTQEIKSEVTHHISQSIWVKDIANGNEFQLQLDDINFPVRPGHVLKIAFDERTKCWERLVNESTGQASYGNGLINPSKIDKYKSAIQMTPFLAAGLAIPFINFIVGIFALGVILSKTPINLHGEKVPNSGIHILLALLAGTGIFIFGTWGFVITIAEPHQHNFIAKAFTVACLATSYLGFVRFANLPFKNAIPIIQRESTNLDDSVRL